jgi:hypothetical protein
MIRRRAISRSCSARYHPWTGGGSPEDKIRSGRPAPPHFGSRQALDPLRGICAPAVRRLQIHPRERLAIGTRALTWRMETSRARGATPAARQALVFPRPARVPRSSAAAWGNDRFTVKNLPGRLLQLPHQGAQLRRGEDRDQGREGAQGPRAEGLGRGRAQPDHVGPDARQGGADRSSRGGLAGSDAVRPRRRVRRDAHGRQGESDRQAEGLPSARSRPGTDRSLSLAGRHHLSTAREYTASRRGVDSLRMSRRRGSGGLDCPGERQRLHGPGPCRAFGRRYPTGIDRHPIRPRRIHHDHPTPFR